MDKLKTIVKVLDEKLAEDIVVIDMSIDSPICDYFVIQVQVTKDYFLH